MPLERQATSREEALAYRVVGMLCLEILGDLNAICLNHGGLQ